MNKATFYHINMSKIKTFIYSKHVHFRIFLT